ncbi:glycoside hydrolase family 19 protein, partial [uncultured Methylobacterium sp.]|uniref:glycoside hydrolase family 19 protein n=1 Tax=uncultured Methylobacterium sp. TaxID=157278 RepID=UPI0035CA780F
IHRRTRLGKRVSVARRWYKRLGNTQAGDGARFHGRGYVQLTGRSNYQDWARRLNVDLVGNPDLALDASVASKILFDGMKLGTFTGRKFSDYFSGTKEDWVNARRIINGTDKAQLISSYGLAYYGAVSYTV